MMKEGPAPTDGGKYAGALADAMKATGARGAILIVFEGRKGHGFSAKMSAEIIAGIPHILRELAFDIERQLAEARADA